MSSVIFSNAQRIIAQIFQWLQTSEQVKVDNLMADTFSAGIDNATTSGEGFLIVPGTNNTSASPSINITLGGIAYDPVGNRIFISSSDVTLYNAANATATTNDGLGNLLPTPQSSGVVNVPLTQSSQNYIWVTYLPAIDTTAFTLNEMTNAKIFYKQVDGYTISVTTLNVPPTANSIYLGSVNMTLGGAVASSNISQVGRTYYQILPKIVPITTPFNDGSNRTPQYHQNTTYTLDAHIKAIGTGTGVTPFNPHNMSLADLGVSTIDTVVGRTQIEGNNNVILAGTQADPFPVTSAMHCDIASNATPTAHILVRQLLVTEFAIVNGAAYNVTDIFGVIPVDANVFFPDLTGTYNVYWDSVAKSFGVTTSSIAADASKLWLCTVTYTFVGHGALDANLLTGLVDHRLIGGSVNLLQRWTTVGRPTIPVSGEFGFNITLNSFEFWDGTQWQQVVVGSANTTVPTGAVLPFAGPVAPGGFLLANGASYLTTAYPALFATIGYAYGGSGGNFNVPDMSGRVPAGTGGALGFSRGQTGGSTSVTLTTGQIPSHSHSISDPGHSHSISDPGHNHLNTNAIGAANGGGSALLAPPQNNGNPIYSYSSVTGISGTNGASTGISGTNNAGGDGSHTNVQPTIGLNYIIKY